MYKCLLLFVFFLASFNAHAWPARVISVTDGDTIDVEPVAGGDRKRVRLHGIDAPEARQPGGQGARDCVIRAALFKVVDVRETPQPQDRYGRIVAVVVMPSGESLQAALLREGWAWVWPKYCRNCEEWQRLQDDARRAGRGLWNETNPEPPWKWRRKPR